MAFGYTGKVLHVDLTNGRFEIETPDAGFYRKYMGGSAMGLFYILRDVPKGADPLGPENVLTLFTGVTTGAPISGLSRINANAKSPISGGIGDSQAGGFFPAELKFAGFDGIVLKGRSPKPVYLLIREGTVELRDAAHLLGKVTGEVDDLLKKELGDDRIEILQHGPAAERGVRFSTLVNMSSRQNGRTGMGLVMASKNLKAVVVRGKQKVEVADPKGLATMNRFGPKEVPNNPDMDSLAKHGTAGVVMSQNMYGTLPTFNYSQGQFESAENISGETVSATILKKRDTCYACVVRCKRVVEIAEGPYKVDPKYGGPEYETTATFGSYCGVGDMGAVALAHQICNEHGIDSIACGATIAFAMDCYEHGVISKEQTGGIELRFGDAQAMLAALQAIVTNSAPLGTVLSQGSERAARSWGNGADEFLIVAKGAEAPAHMPQAKRSLGLIYAVNAFGADHQSSEHDWMIEEGMASDLYMQRLAVMGMPDKLAPMSLGPEKVKFAYLTEVFYSMMDTVELCQFVWGPAWTLYGPQETVDMVKATTGWDVTLDELMVIGMRRINMMRMFNAREGMDRRQDKLSKKFFKTLEGTGPTADVGLTHEEIETAIDEYYRIAGWSENGIPTRETLDKLDLGWLA